MYERKYDNVSNWSETKIAPNLKLKSHVSTKTKTGETGKWAIHISFYIFYKDKKVDEARWNIPYNISENSSDWSYNFEDIELLITKAFQMHNVSIDKDKESKQKLYEGLAKKIDRAVTRDLENGKKIINELISKNKLPEDWDKKLKKKLDKSYLNDDDNFPALNQKNK